MYYAKLRKTRNRRYINFEMMRTESKKKIEII